MDPFIGEIIMFGGNFAPRGWALCDGSLLPISQNTALFSILGTTYGGDGRTTFALPDLRGRAPIGEGNGPGLSNYRLGQKGGTENTTLNITNMPNHTHSVNLSGATVSIPVNTSSGDEDESNPGAGYLANTGQDSFASSPTSNAQYGGSPLPISPVSENTGPSGGSQSFNNMQPFLGLNYIIALQGVYPSRN